MPQPLLDAPDVEITSRADLRAWLAANHGQTRGVWVIYPRKVPGQVAVPVETIVQECLCFGWVDSLVRRQDERRSKLYISPRRAGSNWSLVNRSLVARLQAEGLMTPAGQAVIDRARADGTWTALDGVEALEVPPDLAQALDAAPGARAAWDGFPRSVRRGALEILLNARRPQTRAARIATITDCALQGRRPFQPGG